MLARTTAPEHDAPLTETLVASARLTLSSLDAVSGDARRDKAASAARLCVSLLAREVGWAEALAIIADHAALYRSTERSARTGG